MCTQRGYGWLALRPRLAALDWRPPAALIQILRSLLPGGVGDLDVVDNGFSASGFRHPRRGAFVLDHAVGSVPVGDSALDADGEAVLFNLGFGEFCRIAASIALSCCEVVPFTAGALALVG